MLEIDCHRLQPALLETEQDTRAEFVTRLRRTTASWSTCVGSSGIGGATECTDRRRR